MLKVFIYDQTGKDAESYRRVILQSRLKNLEVESKEWAGDAIAYSGREELLLLAHSTDLSQDQEDELKVAARKGAIVVFYTAGAVEESDNELGDGRVLDMGWNNLLQVLERLPEGFDLAAFGRSVEAVRNRSVVTALAILSWCMTFPTADYEVRRRQDEWKQDRKKWLGIFEGIKREDLLKAAGVDPNKTFPQELTELERFVNWLLSEGAMPNLREVLKELQSQFGMLR